MLHIHVKMSEFYNENDIVLYVFYPNATHLLQALDMILMDVIKTTYKEEVKCWLIANPGEVYDKHIYSFRSSSRFGNEWPNMSMLLRGLKKWEFPPSAWIK